MSKQPGIRTAAKALIVREGYLLAIAKRDTHGLWYLLPGGGQHHGETLEQALLRECLEEIGTLVKIDKLLFVREFIGKNHITYSPNNTPNDEWARNAHTIDFIFACHVCEEYILQNGVSPDDNQEKVEWLPISNLAEYRLYPSALKHLLITSQIQQNIYLGDIH
ncbi:NUDIX domain-containing protein [Calothrix sp. 336/3]|uniref:NUDIX domain-containing protein n=1 Tax=Calothrix sp. 336/3 TaxID=1337936 RepID=UPI0004E2EFF3|nr:NUDIX domain-containing protein [Calothrix sp. 336/3]AKG21731.1 hypothetical protein IJ00_11100 [Calothrix sp. 336/3]